MIKKIAKYIVDKTIVPVTKYVRKQLPPPPPPLSPCRARNFSCLRTITPISPANFPNTKDNICIIFLTMSIFCPLNHLSIRQKGPRNATMRSLLPCFPGKASMPVCSH